MDDNYMQAYIDRASEPENAITILKNLQKRYGGTRGSGKTIMDETIFAALSRAIKSLEKEISMNESTECASNAQCIWVRQDVYDLIKNNPNGVIIEARERVPMIIKTRWK